MGAEHPQEQIQTHGNTSLTQRRTCEQDVLPEQPEGGKRGRNKAGKITLLGHPLDPWQGAGERSSS